MDDALAQHALSLAVNEYQLLALAVLVLLQGAAEHVELILQNVACRHTGSGVEQLRSVEVNDDFVVLELLRHGARLALLAVVARNELSPSLGWCAGACGLGLALLGRRRVRSRAIELRLQLLRVDNRLAHRHVVLNNGIEQCAVVEEVVGCKGVEFVELHGIDAETHVDGRLQHERLLALVGHELHGGVGKLVEAVAPELLHKLLGVGFHLSRGAQCPVGTLGHHICVPYIIVGVVDHIALKGGLPDVAHVGGHEGEIERELVASAALHHRHLEVVSRVAVRLFLAAVVGQSLLQRARVGRVALLLHLNLMARRVVFVAYHYHIVDGKRYLETVGIFNQHDALALETGHATAASLTQESHFVAYLHIALTALALS